MSDDSLPFALRELRTQFSKRITILAVFGAALVLGLSGPFDTDETISLFPRIAYWTGVAFGTFGLGVFVQAALLKTVRRFSIPIQIALSTLAITVAVTLFLLAFNWATIGPVRWSLWEVGILTAQVFAISLIITTFLELGKNAIPASAGTRETVGSVAPILERLPVEKRGPLVSLSVQDHYVDVVTTKGQHTVYMRLTDAIRETGDTRGIKVHRSHWVAVDQILKIERNGDGAVLTMTSDDTIPVSRANLAEVREAGLLS